MAASIDYPTSASFFQEELEILESIYINELTVIDHDSDEEYAYTVSLQLHPATGEDLGKRYVCMTLVMSIPHQYPEKVPCIAIRNPRGVCDEELQILSTAMKDLAKDRQGGHMLYELIEIAKEVLTEGNIPRCPCVICLDHFQEGDIFVKTDCYHYYHSYCLCRYVEHLIKKEQEQQDIPHMKPQEKKMIPCPVCREDIECNMQELRTAPVINDIVEVFKPTEDMKVLRSKMDKLFIEQKEKGGIIDIEAEKQKFYIPDEIPVISGSGEQQKVTGAVNDEKNMATTAKEEMKHQENRPNSYRTGRGRAKPMYDRKSSDRAPASFYRPRSNEGYRRNYSGRGQFRNAERRYYGPQDKSSPKSEYRDEDERSLLSVNKHEKDHSRLTSGNKTSYKTDGRTETVKNNGSDIKLRGDNSDQDISMNSNETHPDKTTRNVDADDSRGLEEMTNKKRVFHNSDRNKPRDYDDRDSRRDNVREFNMGNDRHGDTNRTRNRTFFRGKQDRYSSSRNYNNNWQSREDYKQERKDRHFDFSTHRSDRKHSNEKNELKRSEDSTSSVFSSQSREGSDDSNGKGFHRKTRSMDNLAEADNSINSNSRIDGCKDEKRRQFDFTKHRIGKRSDKQENIYNRTEYRASPRSDRPIKKIVDANYRKDFSAKKSSSEKKIDQCEHNDIPNYKNKDVIGQMDSLTSNGASNNDKPNTKTSARTETNRTDNCDTKTTKRPPPGFELSSSKPVKPPPGFTDFR